MTRHHRFEQCVVVVSLFASGYPNVATGQDIAVLDQTIESLRVEWNVPGGALAVVQDGEIVYIRGFGHRDVEQDLPYTPDTLQRVASTTKSFTSALVGNLVDEGIVEWDRPVRDYYPEFQMVDPDATAQATLEDMLCHRTGLPVMENLLATGVGRVLDGSPRGWRENLLRRLRHFEPSAPFREKWQYQDLMLACVGGILEWITDTNYESLMYQRLLEPLGMSASTFSIQEARDSGQLAQCYAESEHGAALMDHIDVRYIAPSAGLYSNAREMIRWVQFNLDHGKADGVQIVSRESMEWIHSAHMAMNAPWTQDVYGSQIADYAHGWVRTQYQEKLLLIHGGSFNGHRTTMLFMPDENIGVVALCNLNLTSFDYVAARIALDHFMQVESPIDWNTRMQAGARAGEDAARGAEDAFLAGRNPENVPRHNLASYAGTYSHPGYGTFVVTYDDNGLTQTYEGRTYPLTPYDGEVFETRFQSTENSLLRLTMEFTADTDGSVIAMNTTLIPDLSPQRFVRH